MKYWLLCLCKWSGWVDNDASGCVCAKHNFVAFTISFYTPWHGIDGHRFIIALPTIDVLGKVLVLLHVGGCMVDRLFRIWVWVVPWWFLCCELTLELFFCASYALPVVSQVIYLELLAAIWEISPVSSCQIDFLIFCSRLHHYLFSIMSLVWVIIGRMIAGLGFTDGCGPVQRETGYGMAGACVMRQMLGWYWCRSIPCARMNLVIFF